MRFRFCYGQDCPDWVLEQVTAISKQSAIRLKAMVNEIAKYVIEIKDCDLLPYSERDMLKDTTEYNVKKEGIHTNMAAAIAWILFISAQSHISDSELSNELGQLGLPKEHATAISSVYRAKCSDISAVFPALWLRLNPSVAGVNWRIERPLYSFQYQKSDGHDVSITVTVNTTKRRYLKAEYEPGIPVVFSLTKTKLAMLISELQQSLHLVKLLDRNS